MASSKKYSLKLCGLAALWLIRSIVLFNGLINALFAQELMDDWLGYERGLVYAGVTLLFLLAGVLVELAVLITCVVVLARGAFERFEVIALHMLATGCFAVAFVAIAFKLDS